MTSLLSLPAGSPSVDPTIVYKLARSQAERIAAFRLVYQAYTRSRLVDPNPFQMRVTPYHLLPTTETFIATLRSEVISTVTLIMDGGLGLPMESIYAQQVRALRGGGRLAEVSALADRRRRMSRTLPVFVNLMRLMAQFARYHGVQQLLVAVHPRHARFYRQVLRFGELGSLKSYPMVRNNPAVGLCLDLDRLESQWPAVHATYFGTPLAGECFARSAMSAGECAYFAPMAAFGGSFATAGAADSPPSQGRQAQGGLPACG